MSFVAVSYGHVCYGAAALTSAYDISQGSALTLGGVSSSHVALSFDAATAFIHGYNYGESVSYIPSGALQCLGVGSTVTPYAGDKVLHFNVVALLNRTTSHHDLSLSSDIVKPPTDHGGNTSYPSGDLSTDIVAELQQGTNDVASFFPMSHVIN